MRTSGALVSWELRVLRSLGSSESSGQEVGPWKPASCCVRDVSIGGKGAGKWGGWWQE